MNVDEHRAKGVLRELGLDVPAGRLCERPEEAEALAAELGSAPWIVKAEIGAGGRARGHFRDDPGQRGGVREAKGAAELRGHVAQMLGSVLITEQTGRGGERVERVLIEEKREIARELYLALTVDRASGELVFLAAPEGGCAIERGAGAAEAAAERIVVGIDAPGDAPARVARALGLEGEAGAALERFVAALHGAFVARDMLLVEINPLALSPAGALVALDAAIVLDDNARFRQDWRFAEAPLASGDALAALGGRFNYVRLDGDIATLAAGAGLAMATVDAVVEAGGRAANFLDLPPSSEVAEIAAALRVLLEDAEARAVLVNVFGGGIMRCDAVADALLALSRERRARLPIVVRLAGTNAELARSRLAASLPEVVLADDLADAATRAVALAAGGGERSPPRDTAGGGRWWERVRRLVAP